MEPTEIKELEDVRREEIATLARRATTATVWSKFNLAESLPEPTPMTWAILRLLLSGKGGLGQAYRDLGFRPDPSLDSEGACDLICGRPYCNLSREPLFYAEGLPLRHSFEALKADPRSALDPHPDFDWTLVGWRFLFSFPQRFIRSIARTRKQSKWERQLPDYLRRLFPGWAESVRRETQLGLSSRPTPELLQLVDTWTQKTLRTFAADSLKPALFAELRKQRVHAALSQKLGAKESTGLLSKLLVGIRPDPEADVGQAVEHLQGGRLDLPTFLEHFGHRCNLEMELSVPRWIEDHADIDSLPAQAVVPEKIDFDISRACREAAGEAGLSNTQRTRLEVQVRELRFFLSLRETAKHSLLMGYGVIRSVLVELDRRMNLDGGIFFLEPAELSRLVAGENMSTVIAHRRHRRFLALSLEVPPVIFSDDLDAIGRPTHATDRAPLVGVPVSPGIAEGIALVLREPGLADLPAQSFILVCPSTDPAWVPLFRYASGLLMETGGVLSHGAIVAREFGLPAVGGVERLMARVKTGDRVRVNGTTGEITKLS
jgi:pyruvate,water dikinase